MSQPYNVSMLNFIYLLTPFGDVKCYIRCSTAPKVLPKIMYELSIIQCQELTVPRPK